LSTTSEVPIDYLPQATNVGFAGGLAAAIERIVEVAEPDDWVMICPDDIPLDTTDFAVKTVRVANTVLSLDPYTGAVGRLGSEIDVSVGRMKKWHRSHPASAWAPRIQPVDFIATGPAPVFRVRCFLEAGGFRRELFIGMTEVELCMRLRRVGFSLYVLPDLPFVRPTKEAWTEGPARMGSPWREYYSVRNFLTVMREHSTRRSTAYFAVRHGILRPVARLLARPSRTESRRLLMSWRGVRDAYRGRLGAPVKPESALK
jgi:GT2 family glycosyltransferase